jgi:nuclear pore complex protein Nup93
VILLRAAAQCEAQQHLPEAIKLYHLAGAHSTVVLCLARGLGECITEPEGGGEEARALENTARELLRHYDRTNRVTVRERDIVVRLLGILGAIEAKRNGKLEAALEVCIFGLTRRSSQFIKFR